MMTWRDVKIRHDICCENKTQIRKIFDETNQTVLPCSEVLIRPRVEGYCVNGQLWIVELGEIQKEQEEKFQCEPVKAIINCKTKSEPAKISKDHEVFEGRKELSYVSSALIQG
ncbi:hypothetical protein EVAR_73110_1 [Eumeta japonica]|uniref:Uncharacterized protein n=1 Tax=Eumeta variegata TaxID=151549 RepID=A0A4C1STJ7_EUMVA|nr:hypothetical protein EVAR_73110_1 [Eumeta japonica]